MSKQNKQRKCIACRFVGQKKEFKNGRCPKCGSKSRAYEGPKRRPKGIGRPPKNKLLGKMMKPSRWWPARTR